MWLLLTGWTLFLMSTHLVESKPEVIVWSTETRIDLLVARVSKLELAMKAIEPSTKTRICKGNVTSDQFEVHGAESDFVEGLRVQVNTSTCNFTRTPTYFATMSGKWAHWGLLGTSAVYTPTPTEFIIYLGHVLSQYQMNGQELLAEAKNENYKWQLDWIGID